MTVIDYVNGHDVFDGSLWFEDGNYLGHDDQIDITTHFVPLNKEVVLTIRHRQVRNDLTEEQVNELIFTCEDGLDAAESYLVPLEE